MDFFFGCFFYLFLSSLHLGYSCKASCHSKSCVDHKENPERILRMALQIVHFVLASLLNRIWSLQEILLLPLAFNTDVFVGRSAPLCSTGLFSPWCTLRSVMNNACLCPL